MKKILKLMAMATGKDELDSYVNLILQQKNFSLALLIDTERLLFHRTPMQSIEQQCLHSCDKSR